MLINNMFGIDLGTDTVKIYNDSRGSISREKSRVAIRKKETVFAVGDEAEEMVERTPKDIQVYTPMANGRISDISLVEVMLHTLLDRVFLGYRPTLFFTVPMDTTEIEKRAYYTIAHRGRLKRCRVFLVEKPIADALALGIPITKTKGSMVINMGAQSTEVSVIADQRVIISKVIPIGGNQFDASIVAAVRRFHNFQISYKTAGDLKLNLADFTGKNTNIMKVMGIDATTGLPRDGIVTSYTITVTLQDQLHAIAEEIQNLLNRTPPQIYRAIKEEGIYLAGGSTRLSGVDSYLKEFLSCPIKQSTLYELCTINGLKELITHPPLHKYAFTPKKRKY
ncbi:MAG: rod shape-determining protein [Lachnospiraceae bacterium]|nr:rod shape-determining protein [Lachnospiraceae bacterium]